MTLLDGPGVVDPDTWAFDFLDLEDRGVQFAEEQLELWRMVESGQQVTALTIGFPADPEAKNFVQRPLFTYDDLGQSSVVAVPAIVTLTPDQTEFALSGEGPPGVRYPSLCGRRLEPTYSREWGPDVEIMHAEMIRLWNLWPISEVQVSDVLDATRLWREANYEQVEAWYACDAGDMDPCDLVTEYEHVPYDDHQHREHIDRLTGEAIMIECRDGEEWMERFKLGHFCLDQDGMLVPRSMPDLLLCDDELQLIWEHLRTTSQMNSYRAITAIPPRYRPAVLRTERHYSPWLWS